MDEKKNALFTTGILAAILLVFFVADLFCGDRIYSEMENRLLAKRPVFSREAFFKGEFREEYEEYLTDQLAGRDKWVGIKIRMDILSGKKEVNGVYLGKDDYLIEQHPPDMFSRQEEVKKAVQLRKLVEEWNARVMLVPTADNVLTDKLPSYTVCYDETRLLQEVREQVGERSYIDVYSVLQEHKDEEIYYRTDHHWTSRGAYYGYLAWTQETHSFLYPYNIDGMTTVSENFRGTQHSRVPVVGTKDVIQIFPETELRKVSVTYDFGRTAASFYEPGYLDTKNQYAFFLDENHAFIEIDTDYKTDRTLFLIRDSYANSMIPLLQPHYSKIYVLDPRYYSGSVSELMKQYEPEGGMDVLVLYDCVHFMENFRY